MAELAICFRMHGPRNTKESKANPNKLRRPEATHATNSTVQGSYATKGRAS